MARSRSPSDSPPRPGMLTTTRPSSNAFYASRGPRAPRRDCANFVQPAIERQRSRGTSARRKLPDGRLLRGSLGIRPVFRQRLFELRPVDLPVVDQVLVLEHAEGLVRSE